MSEDWILCSDRLPDNSCLVSLTVENNRGNRSSYPTAYYSRAYGRWRVRLCNGGHDTELKKGEVPIAWRELDRSAYERPVNEIPHTWREKINSITDNGIYYRIDVLRWEYVRVAGIGGGEFASIAAKGVGCTYRIGPSDAGYQARRVSDTTYDILATDVDMESAVRVANDDHVAQLSEKFLVEAL